MLSVATRGAEPAGCGADDAAVSSVVWAVGAAAEVAEAAPTAAAAAPAVVAPPAAAEPPSPAAVVVVPASAEASGDSARRPRLLRRGLFGVSDHSRAARYQEKKKGG